MQVGRRVRSVVVLAAALTMCGTGVAHAGAGDDAHAVAAGSSVSAGLEILNSVACPAGERAIGGGVRPDPFESDHALLQSGPWGNGAQIAGDGVALQWRSQMRNLSGSFSDYINFAMCSASSDAIARFTSIVTSAGGAGEGSTVIECDPGERVIGGGVIDSSGLTPSATIESSVPLGGATVSSIAELQDGAVPTAWFVDARANGHLIAGYAICSATSKATIQVEGSNVQSMTHPDFNPQCPNGQRALGGGAGTAATDVSSSLDWSAPTNAAGELLPGDGVASGWSARIAGLHNSSTGGRLYKVVAICEGPAGSNPGGGGGSNAFKLGKLTRNKRKGTAELTVTVPGPGTVKLNSPKLKPQTEEATKATDLEVLLKATGGAKRKLKRKGKVNVTATVTFTPTDGRPSARVEQTKLKRKRKR